MADVCSHKDESRRQVSATAHGVAYGRYMETKIYGDKAWFVDAYAEKLAGQVGSDYIQQRREHNTATAGKTRDESGFYLNWMSIGSIRTRKIDEEILKAVNEDGFQQICVVGAGLDARPWRLQKTVGHSVSYFEIDFPEIFEWKLSVLKEASAVTPFEYHSVSADLSLPGWAQVLVQSGFDTSTRTLWLLEGFIGYLTEDEANTFMTTVTTVLSAVNSRIVATIITRATSSNGLHRFFPPEALSWLNSHGWDGTQIDIHELGELWGRPIPVDLHPGYMICVVEKK